MGQRRYSDTGMSAKAGYAVAQAVGDASARIRELGEHLAAELGRAADPAFVAFGAHNLAALADAGLLSRSAMVCNCGLPNEEVWPDLADYDPARSAGYFATILVKEG